VEALKLAGTWQVSSELLKMSEHWRQLISNAVLQGGWRDRVSVMGDGVRSVFQSNSRTYSAGWPVAGRLWSGGLQFVICLSPLQTEAELLAEKWFCSFSQYCCLASLIALLNLL